MVPPCDACTAAAWLRLLISGAALVGAIRTCAQQVHDYNRVVGGLDARERVLFHDRLRALDRRITPGCTKLAWTADRSTLDFYFREVRCTGVAHMGS